MISLHKVDFTYPNRVRVLDGLDFVLGEGKRAGIIGPNGSGKTTMLHIVMGLLKPASGKIVLFEKSCVSEDDFREARRKMGFVFQDADDQLFCPTVAEDVGFGPRNLGHTAKEAHKIIHRTLDLLGIGHLEHRVTYQLSGGEKRLVALATALAMEPEVLILDEPTTGLTEDAAENLLSVLDHHTGSLVVVSQDRKFLDHCVETVLTLEKGKLNERSPG